MKALQKDAHEIASSQNVITSGCNHGIALHELKTNQKRRRLRGKMNALQKMATKIAPFSLTYLGTMVATCTT